MPARSLEMMSQDRAMPLLATWTTVELLSKAPISKFQNLHHMHAQLGTTFANEPLITLQKTVTAHLLQCIIIDWTSHAKKSSSSSLKLYDLIQADQTD